MRFFISMLLLVGATVLACHGFFNEESAWDAYKAIAGGSVSGQALAANTDLPTSRDVLIRMWPYTTAASKARADILAAWVEEQPAEPKESAVKGVWDSIRSRGFVSDLPFAFPPGAAAIAVAALLLGVFMPRTRFRDFTIAFLLLGTLAIWPALAPPADQVTYVSWVAPVRHLVAYFPQIAVGLMFVAGLLMIGKRQPARQGA